MTVLDTALRKALAGAARFLPQLTQRAEAALVADHQPSREPETCTATAVPGFG